METIAQAFKDELSALDGVVVSSPHWSDRTLFVCHKGRPYGPGAAGKVGIIARMEFYIDYVNIWYDMHNSISYPHQHFPYDHPDSIRRIVDFIRQLYDRFELKDTQ